MIQPFDPNVNWLASEFLNQWTVSTPGVDFRIRQKRGFLGSYPPHLGKFQGFMQWDQSQLAGLLGVLTIPSHQGIFHVIKDFRLLPKRRIIQHWLEQLPHLLEQLDPPINQTPVYWPFWIDGAFLKQLFWTFSKRWPTGLVWDYVTDIYLNVIFEVLPTLQVPPYWQLVPIPDPYDPKLIHFLRKIEAMRQQPISPVWRRLKNYLADIQVWALHHETENQYYALLAATRHAPVEIEIQRLNSYSPDTLMLQLWQLLGWIKPRLRTVTRHWSLCYLGPILTWNNWTFRWSLKLFWNQVMKHQPDGFLCYLQPAKAYRLDLSPWQFLYLKFSFQLMKIQGTHRDALHPDHDLWMYYHPSWVL